MDKRDRAVKHYRHAMAVAFLALRRQIRQYGAIRLHWDNAKRGDSMLYMAATCYEGQRFFAVSGPKDLEYTDISRK